MNDINLPCDRVRETAYAIHVFHGHGHLEKVYENALAHRLKKAGIDVKQQHPIQIFDEDGTLVGEYYADMVVEGALIVELKATKALGAEHQAQILGYLAGARLDHGLLINFGSYKFQIRKFARSKGPGGMLTGWAPPVFSAISAFVVAQFSRWIERNISFKGP